MSDLVTIARQRIDDTQRTHWEGCERDHRECLIQRMADEIERLRATLERQQLSYERERQLDQEEIERLIAIRCDDVRELKRMRALIAEAEVIAEYGRDDGWRDWANVGTWLSPGERVVVLREESGGCCPSPRT